MDGVPYITQDPIMPGGSLTYEFTVVDPPGMYVYHSHFNSTEQVGTGLYGALDRASRRRRPTGARGRYGELGSRRRRATLFLGDGPLGYVLNGKSFPATQPIVAKQGDWVLIHMANDGSMLHPMHLHGYHFEVVAPGRFPARASRYMADTLVVAPGQRFDVLGPRRLPRRWAFHCHILPHVEGPAGHVRDGDGAGRAVARLEPERSSIRTVVPWADARSRAFPAEAAARCSRFVSPLPRGTAARVEAVAIVVDLEHRGPVAAEERDAAGRRARVPSDVRQRLAGELYDVARLLGQLGRDRLVELDDGHDAALDLELLDEHTQRLVELAVGEDPGRSPKM